MWKILIWKDHINRIKLKHLKYPRIVLQFKNQLKLWTISQRAFEYGPQKTE